jgi:uncharacterized damage-inducible protein DinB
MQARDAIKTSLRSTQEILEMYVADLSDADLQTHPVPKANNIAWQLAHLTSSEAHLGSVIPGTQYPELPARVKVAMDGKAPAGGHLSKAELLDCFKQVRAATLANVDRMSETDFDKPTTGDMAKFAPTQGALLLLVANHTLMHAGQFTVTRRALGKPVLF